jgi:acyl-CoA reductase-like NAD-dependent aldehyde dehydrogenase
MVAEPVGVVMAITPVTNPTSTVLFKAIVAAKTRNAIVFRPSPHARCAAPSGRPRSCARPARRRACRPAPCR